MLKLKHKFTGMQLQPKYTKETIQHIKMLWGHDISLETKIDETDVNYYTKGDSVELEQKNKK